MHATQRLIFNYLSENPRCTATEIADALKTPERTILRNLKDMREIRIVHICGHRREAADRRGKKRFVYDIGNLPNAVPRPMRDATAHARKLEQQRERRRLEAIKRKATGPFGVLVAQMTLEKRYDATRETRSKLRTGPSEKTAGDTTA